MKANGYLFVMAVTSEELVKAFQAGQITFDDAVRTEPEAAWAAIVELSRQPLTAEQIAVLAAGPLEDLLTCRGPVFIDRVEREARVSRVFRHLLGGVWRSSIPEPVWRRVESIRGPAW